MISVRSGLPLSRSLATAPSEGALCERLGYRSVTPALGTQLLRASLDCKTLEEVSHTESSVGPVMIPFRDR
jgi:hypothetical protein